MYSELPKVLHQLAGKSLLEHVHHTASKLETRGIHVIYGYGGAQLIEEHSHLDVDWVEQKEQLGTGHAVKQALPNIPDKDLVLVLYGDIPLITNETLSDLVSAAEETTFSLLTTFVEHAFLHRDEDVDYDHVQQQMIEARAKYEALQKLRGRSGRS